MTHDILRLADCLPRFEVVRPSAKATKQRGVIVFIHGIYSSHATFDALLEAFARDLRFGEYDLATYDYNWGQPILESASQLRRILDVRVPAGAEVTIVAHSMGGLVSRFAVVGGDLPCVKRLFMLGTPNFGAFTARQLGVVWQVAIAAAGKIKPIFPRKAGLRDLTRPQTLYTQIEGDNPSIPPARAKGVEYVTIPGLFYRDERRTTDPGKQNEALPFTASGLTFDVISNFPLTESTSHGRTTASSRSRA